MENIEHPQFTVDTGLFRQLGELLVGRDATALIELVKNSYDADATAVVVEGIDLDDPVRGIIRIVDNGRGMTVLQFEKGFLRLAASGKARGDRRSSVFERRYTGEKGVGRLAAHKLGAHLSVTSIANSATAAPARISSLTHASIDWDLIEEAETLSTIEGGLSVQTGPNTSSASSGTTLEISRLRHLWSQGDLRELARQMRNFEPPNVLANPLRSKILKQPLLFERPRIRDSGTADPGMKVDLTGDFKAPTEYWANVEAGAEWVLEIVASKDQPIRYMLSPTVTGSRNNKHGAPLAVTMPHPSPSYGPFFEARILLRPGNISTEERTWTQENSGVRVYLEGFRVLPYGESGNDWLSLDLAYTRRSGKVQIDPAVGGPESELSELRSLKQRDVSLRVQPNRNFYGAVFLTDSGAGGLRTLVNREGFVPDEHYENLRSMIKVGFDVLHRSWANAGYLASRAAAEAKAKEVAAAAQAAMAALQSEESRGSADTENSEQPTETFDEGAEGPDKNDPAHPASQNPTRGADRDGRLDDDDDNLDDEDDLTANDHGQRGRGAQLLFLLAQLKAIIEEIEDSRAKSRALSALELSEVQAASLLEDVSLLRVLASVGSQLTSFTHEIAHLVSVASSTEAVLQKSRPGDNSILRARQAVSELRQSIEKQASYLVDLSSSSARRRRSKQDLRERVDAAFFAVSGSAAIRDVTLENDVPQQYLTPPMFRAELQSVLSNLLTNAIKAAEVGGTVRIAVDEANEDELTFSVQNTGIAVSPVLGEVWFAPYASTTVVVDAELGQGMGLGLPITRQLVSEYGGTVRFVDPDPRFATAVQIRLPK